MAESQDPLGLDALELFCQRLVPHLVPMMRERFGHEFPDDTRSGRYDGLVSLLGFTPDTTILVTRFCEPQRLVVLHTEETRELLEPVRRHCGLPPERIVFECFDKHALPTLHLVLAKTIETHLGSLGRVGVELTGGTKPMAAALHFAAAMMDLDTLYLDYDRYRPEYRKPEPETLHLSVIHSPLREPYRVSTPLHLSQMAAAATHEMNQPVANIRTAVARAQADRREGLFVDTDLDPLLSSIHRNSDRMARMIDTFRRFARRDSVPFDAVSDIVDVVHQVAAIMEADLRSRGTELRLLLPNRGEAFVRAPEVLIEEILYNLLVNARDALSSIENPRIEVKICKQGESLKIEIADNGPGLPPSYRNHLFVPFVSTKPSAEGSGLGLFLTHRIVRELAGTISYEDVPDGGTRFTILLPRAERGAIDE